MEEAISGNHVCHEAPLANALQIAAELGNFPPEVVSEVAGLLLHHGDEVCALWEQGTLQTAGNALDPRGAETEQNPRPQSTNARGGRRRRRRRPNPPADDLTTADVLVDWGGATMRMGEVDRVVGQHWPDGGSARHNVGEAAAPTATAAAPAASSAEAAHAPAIVEGGPYPLAAPADLGAMVASSRMPSDAGAVGGAERARNGANVSDNGRALQHTGSHVPPGEASLGYTELDAASQPWEVAGEPGTQLDEGMISQLLAGARGTGGAAWHNAVPVGPAAPLRQNEGPARPVTLDDQMALLMDDLDSGEDDLRGEPALAQSPGSEDSTEAEEAGELELEEEQRAAEEEQARRLAEEEVTDEDGAGEGAEHARLMPAQQKLRKQEPAKKPDADRVEAAIAAVKHQLERKAGFAQVPAEPPPQHPRRGRAGKPKVRHHPLRHGTTHACSRHLASRTHLGFRRFPFVSFGNRKKRKRGKQRKRARMRCIAGACCPPLPPPPPALTPRVTYAGTPGTIPTGDPREA